MSVSPEATALIALRTAYGMTQAEAAQLLYVSTAAYRTWEQGVRPMPDWVLHYYPVIYNHVRGVAPTPESKRWRYGLVDQLGKPSYSEYAYSSWSEALEAGHNALWAMTQRSAAATFADPESRTAYQVLPYDPMAAHASE